MKGPTIKWTKTKKCNLHFWISLSIARTLPKGWKYYCGELGKMQYEVCFHSKRFEHANMHLFKRRAWIKLNVVLWMFFVEPPYWTILCADNWNYLMCNIYLIAVRALCLHGSIATIHISAAKLKCEHYVIITIMKSKSAGRTTGAWDLSTLWLVMTTT